MSKILLSAIMIALSFSSYAESYWAPDLKLQEVSEAKSMQADSWDNEYRVGVRPLKIRSLASEPKEKDEVKAMPMREPSSKDLDKEKEESAPEFWKFKDIH